MPTLKRIRQKLVTKSKLFFQRKIMRYGFTHTRKVLNKGVNGNNSFNLLTRLQGDVIAHSPNIVIIMVGTNDALNIAQRVDIEQYRKNLLELIRQFTSQGISALLCTPPMVDDEIAVLPNKNNLNCNQLLQPFRQVVMETGSKTNTSVLDIYGLFEVENKPKVYLMNSENSSSNDGVHPTAEGYTFIAHAIHKKLKEMNATNHKIVCFGDSITFGYLVKNEGQEVGESYPAQLNAML